MIRGSKELIRDINCTNVLREILRCEPISRAMLSKQLGLTKATISSIVQDLIQQKLVMEIGSEETQFGRKPILLAFNRKAGYAISIDLGNTVISAKLTDLKGETSQFKKVQTPDSKKALLDCLFELVKNLETYTKDSIFGIIGISIAIHGFTYNNQIAFHSDMDLSNLSLDKEIEHYFHIPVHLESSANLSVLGVHYRYPDLSNFVSLNLCDFVSLGIMLHKKLYTGVNGYAGNIGKMLVPSSASSPDFSQMEYIERYISEQNLLKTYQEQTHNDSANLASLLSAYENKEPIAVSLMNQYKYYLQICINNIYTLYNPERIILCSNILKACPSVFKTISDNFQNSFMEPNCLVFTDNKSELSLSGGILIAIKKFLIDYKKQYPNQQDFHIPV